MIKNKILFAFTIFYFLVGCNSDYKNNKLIFAINGKIIPNTVNNTPPKMTDTSKFLSVKKSEDIFVDAAFDSNKKFKNLVWHIQGIGKVSDSLTYSFIPIDSGFIKIGLCNNDKDCIYKWVYVEKENTNNYIATKKDTLIDKQIVLGSSSAPKIKPETNKPTTNNPTTNNPITNKPTTKKPATNKPETNKPEDNKLSTDKLSTDKPATDNTTLVAESNFMCNNDNNSIGLTQSEAINSCDKKTYIKPNYLIIKAKRKLRLEGLSVYSDSDGYLKLSVNGDNENFEPKKTRINKGFSQITLDDWVFEPGNTYQLKIKQVGHKKVKLFDASSCFDKKEFSNNNISISFKNGLYIFDIKYCY